MAVVIVSHVAPSMPLGNGRSRRFEIAEEDAITDSAEAYYLMKQRGIENVLVMGVHTNMCVLGRPFSIRQLVYQGQHVALVRDLTDTMYNSRMPPFVSHFGGTDRVVDHIERHWCPTITSDQLIGGMPFRFSQDRRPHLVVMIGEERYHTRRTLPAFVESWLERDFVVDYVLADRENRPDVPRHRTCSGSRRVDVECSAASAGRDQLAVIRQYVASGKPLVALRTSSHAFDIRDGSLPAGAETWPEFDGEVLGGHYHGHYESPDPATGQTWIRTAQVAAEHPVLEGVRARALSGSIFAVQDQPAATVDRSSDLGVGWPAATLGTGRLDESDAGRRTRVLHVPGAPQRLSTSRLPPAAGECRTLGGGHSNLFGCNSCGRSTTLIATIPAGQPVSSQASPTIGLHRQRTAATRAVFRVGQVYFHLLARGTATCLWVKFQSFGGQRLTTKITQPTCSPIVEVIGYFFQNQRMIMTLITGHLGQLTDCQFPDHCLGRLRLSTQHSHGSQSP